ncbi:MAG TPA: ribulose-phosphate 3-epimerase [Candidatus Bathyarchaeia archaeon]|nr:ribulose-phosphate 3-epimerase [Candidatus Bathyarchaeia archaeon]
MEVQVLSRALFTMQNKPIQISVSILCADFANLTEEIKKIEKAGADMVHVDVMDGHFVPPVTIGALLVKAVRPLTKLPIEAHLMVEYPETMIDDFANAGADIISIHAECYGNLKKECRGFGEFPKEIDRLDTFRAKGAVARIKALGKKAFMVVNPGTAIGLLEPLLPDLDGVLVMSVNPGFSHQKFMPVSLSKLQYLAQHFSGDVAIDGGINQMTGAEAVKAGANILATASYFFNAQQPAEAVRLLKTGTP